MAVVMVVVVVEVSIYTLPDSSIGIPTKWPKLLSISDRHDDDQCEVVMKYICRQKDPSSPLNQPNCSSHQVDIHPRCIQGHVCRRVTTAKAATDGAGK